MEIAGRLRALILVVALCSATTRASDSWLAPIPAKLLMHLKAALPGAEVVRPDEIDSKSCQPVPSNPTVVEENLAGNDRIDFALLIKLKETGKQAVWQGKTLTEAQFALVLFTDNGLAGYATIRLNEFTGFVPLGAFIDVDPAGKLHNSSTDKNLTTRHPAVSLVFCEKSETAYYIQGDRVTAVPISD